MMPDELENIKEQLKAVAEELQKTVSIEKMIEIGETAEELKGSSQGLQVIKGTRRDEAPVIAVARDEAFCFYYEDNLRILKEYGAKLKYFSPIYDESLPEGSSGILLGGGYPELYGAQLSRNKKMQIAIKTAIAGGMPVVAECGGFMYLHSKIVDKEKQSFKMAGVIPADCYYTGKSVRFGYIELREKKHNFLPEKEVIKGHEFHYFESESSGEDCLAIKPVTGKCYPCVISGENCFMGFPHLYYPSNPAFAEAFVEKTVRYLKRS
jgi:cobyrinic acid a,c-diamide synthase